MAMTRTPIARNNLLHDRRRTAIALAGLGFSLIVIFLQLGFLRSVLTTATTVLDKLDYDIMIVSKNYHYVADAGRFPLARLVQARAVPGVERVLPLYVRMGLWLSLAPQHEDANFLRRLFEVNFLRRLFEVLGFVRPRVESWRHQSVLVLGLSPEGRFPAGLPFKKGKVFDQEKIAEQLNQLARPWTLLIDRRSRPEFGPQDAGTRVELNQEDYEIADQCDIGTGFAASGAALLENHNFARAFGGAGLDEPSLGLVKLKPGEDNAEVTREYVAEVARRLAGALPTVQDDVGDASVRFTGDVRVVPREKLEYQEQRYWIREKAIGSIFFMGVVISLLVGLIVVYQVLSSDIADHMGEYATLKALGWTDRRIAWVVIEQALLLGIIGYVLALIVSAALYALVERYTLLPMSVCVWWILALPMFLAVFITAGSALLSIQEVRKADPADLFR